MPGMSGVDMYDRLLALGCAPPTIFITALLSSDVKVKIQAEIQANCAPGSLEKSVNAAAIEQCLSLVLGEP
jgi:FixJ family two-component response regulator